ncbi:MAG: hypothetical protein ACI4R5_09405 [Acetatifactor sp.]
MEAIHLIILGCLWLFFFRVFDTEGELKKEEKTAKEAQGIIRQILVSSSTTKYEVDILDGDKILPGKSDSYVGIKPHYKEGEQVRIKYCPRRYSYNRVLIQDDTLIPVEISPRWKYAFLILALLFFAGAVVVIISKII